MAVIHEIRRALQPISATVQALVSRVVISGIRWAPKLATAQMRGLFGEVLEGVEHFGHYGFSSFPLEGAEGIVVRVGAVSDHTVLIATADRRFKITLEKGEVALHDDLGQSVHLKRNGITINSAAGWFTVLTSGTAIIQADGNVVLAPTGNASILPGGLTELGGAGGKAVARVGDTVSGGVITSGSSKVFAVD